MFKDLFSQSSKSLNNSFIFSVIKIILSCYLLVFLFEIFKTFEDSLYKRIGR